MRTSSAVDTRIARSISALVYCCYSPSSVAETRRGRPVSARVSFCKPQSAPPRLDNRAVLSTAWQPMRIASAANTRIACSVSASVYPLRAWLRLPLSWSSSAAETRIARPVSALVPCYYCLSCVAETKRGRPVSARVSLPSVNIVARPRGANMYRCCPYRGDI